MRHPEHFQHRSRKPPRAGTHPAASSDLNHSLDGWIQGSRRKVPGHLLPPTTAGGGCPQLKAGAAGREGAAGITKHNALFARLGPSNSRAVAFLI